MFKVYYKGELASETEFKTKSEAKNAVAPVLAGMKGMSVEELLTERDDTDIKTFQIIGKYTYNPEKTVARVCSVCGKTFYVPSERSLKKTCSEECQRVHLRKYNSAYCKRIYNERGERREKALLSNRASSKRAIGKKRWNKRLAFADAILTLAKFEDARDLIATYLDKEVIKRGARGATNKEFRCSGEVEAEKRFYEVLNSLEELTNSQ